MAATYIPSLLSELGGTITTAEVSGFAAAADARVAAAVGVSVQAYDADLDAIAALSDPGADRILFWDDSAGAYAYLTPGTGLTITGTTIDASGGGGGTSPPYTGGTANPLVKDATDATKLLAFDPSGLTTATTRTLSAPDADGRIAVSAAEMPTGRIPYTTAGGLLDSSAGLTFNGNNFNLSATAGYVNTWIGMFQLFGNYSNSAYSTLEVDNYSYGGTDAVALTIIGGSGTTTPLVKLQGMSDTTTKRTLARIDAVFSTTTDATYLGDLVLYSQGYNGSHEAIRFKDTGSISQVVIPIANVRDAADDTAAAALSPAVPVGGIYRSGSALKIRVS